MTSLINEFNGITKMKVFEIGVMDTRTNEKDWILFDIEISTTKKPSIYATHVSLTEEEENSNLIALKSIYLDENFTLDENLQSLYDECIEAILHSDFYELSE